MEDEKKISYELDIFNKIIYFTTPVHKFKIQALKETTEMQLELTAKDIFQQISQPGGFVMLPSGWKHTFIESNSPLPLSD